MKEEKKKVQRVSAGDVILVEFTGRDRPCNRSLCITLIPMKIKDGAYIDKIHVAYAIDVDKEVFLPDGAFNNLQANIGKVKDRKLKNWFFETVVKLCRKTNGKEKTREQIEE